jgi:hypothetical protein
MKDFYPYDDYEPDFVNDGGVKWWKIENMSQQLKDGGVKAAAYHVLLKSGEKQRVITDGKGIIYKTGSVEALSNQIFALIKINE